MFACYLFSDVCKSMQSIGRVYVGEQTIHLLPHYTLCYLSHNNDVQIVQSMTTPASANEAVPEMRAMIQHGK